MAETLRAPLAAAGITHQRVVFPQGLLLDCGVRLTPLVVAYRTYGRLNDAKSNAILACHALTGDQYVAETHPVTGKPGWWESMVGPGLPVDTDRFFVICANVLGGCMGSSGPREEMTDAEGRPQGRPWGVQFPPVTVRDMVRAQAMLLDHLGLADEAARVERAVAADLVERGGRVRSTAEVGADLVARLVPPRPSRIPSSRLP